MADEDDNTIAAKSEMLTAQRDPSFLRISADVSFAALIGSDIDIALIQRQAQYRNITMGPQEQPVALVASKTLYEVGRLRMPVESAMLLAFNIFGACATGGLIDLENFEQNLDVVRAELREVEKDRP